MSRDSQPLIFERSVKGRKAYSLPDLDVPEMPLESLLPSELLRETPPALPEVSEPDLVRHYTALSRLNYGVDNGFYPLGSCTMKYNPKMNEAMVRLAGLSDIHPYQPEETVQGPSNDVRAAGVLAEIAGMDAVSAATGRRRARGDDRPADGRAYPRTGARKRRRLSIPTRPTAPTPPAPPGRLRRRHRQEQRAGTGRPRRSAGQARRAHRRAS